MTPDDRTNEGLLVSHRPGVVAEMGRDVFLRRASGACRLAAWTISSSILGLSTAANAQSTRDRFWLEASYYWPSAETIVRAEDRESQEFISNINLEDDLGFERTDSLPEFSGGARLGGGFRVIVEYLAINRGAEAQISKELGFGKHTFEASARIKSSFDTEIYRFSLGWDAFRGKNFVIGISGGLHATNFAIRLEGQAKIGNQSAGVVSEKRDALAPLPTVGIYAIYDVVPQITLQGRVDYIDLTLNNAGGRLINAEASVIYNFNPYIGLGVGFRHVDYNLEIVKRDWIGSIKYDFNGPRIVLKAALP